MANTIVIVSRFEEVRLRVTPFENTRVRLVDSPEVRIIVPVSGVDEGIFDETFDETFE